MWDVFISHASEDKDFVARPLAEALSNRGLKVWYDEFTLQVGDSIRRSIDEGLSKSTFGIVILSRSFFNKNWPQKELDALAAKESVILPIWHNITKDEVTNYSPTLADIVALDTSKGLPEIVDKLLASLSKKKDKSGDKNVAQRRPRLCDRLVKSQWKILQQASIRAVTAGGMAAMGYYRQPLVWPEYLSQPKDETKNPSTIADLEATTAILQTIEPYLSPLARQLGCSLIFLGEETRFRDWLRNTLSQSAFESIKDPEEFFVEEDNSIRVIFDGVDGTGSFIRGFPLFCSAVAILIGNRVRVSAVYDPIHHIVYSGLLQGSYEDPTSEKEAYSREVATGNKIDLIQLAKDASKKQLKDEALGIHLTRSNPDKLREFLSPDTSLRTGTLLRLAEASGGIYAINSGIVSLADVAKGALGGFINNVTNLWDVAAGEVLIRACEGRITEIDKQEIAYSYPHKVSVVAAKEHLHSEIIEILGT